MTGAGPLSEGEEEHVTPRWVKVSAGVVLALVVIFLGLHLAGFGFGGHGP